MKTCIRSILWFTIAFYSLLYYVLFQVGIFNLQIYRIPLLSTYNDIVVPNFCDTPIHCRDSTVETGHSADQSLHQDRKETRDNARKKVGKEASLVGPVRGTDRETRQSNRVTRRSQCQPCAKRQVFHFHIGGGQPWAMSLKAPFTSTTILSHTVQVWSNGLSRRQKFIFIE